MVYFADPHETLEKAHWCYQRGMLRLVGEANAEVSLFTAGRFRIDSLICDSVTLPVMLPHFESMQEPLESISIVGDSFDPQVLASYASYAKRIRLVLSLPETGAFAEAPLCEDPLFAPYPDCLIEDVEGDLILTKLRLLVTPIIRYDTGVRFTLRAA